jgi:CRISPR type II-A-associated protein Csn2
MVVEDEVSRSLANQLNENILEIITNLLDQMNANYDLADDWDSQKYLKAMGFCIDESGVAGVFDKAILLLGVIADLMPDVILVFVNLMTYLSDEQCHEFCNQVKALELTVLTYEIGSTIIPEYFDNGLYVDANYLESSLLLS